MTAVFGFILYDWLFHITARASHTSRQVCVCLSVCGPTSRSAEVQPVMTLLCLIGTAATVTFTNAMNQRQRRDRPADQKTTNYTASRLTLGGQGRERDGGTLNTLQGRISTGEWGHRLTGGLLGCSTNTVTLKTNTNPSATRWNYNTEIHNVPFIIS